jgi:hypothetical protein
VAAKRGKKEKAGEKEKNKNKKDREKEAGLKPGTTKDLMINDES